MKLELHILQNFAPSCLNRDDMNTPKDCQFGGVRRARISSQCLKRSFRTHRAFTETLAANTGLRTKLLVTDLVRQLLESGVGPEDQIRPVVERIVQETHSKLDKKESSKGRTDVLLFLGKDEITRLRDLIVSHWDALKTATEVPGSQKKASPIEQLVKEIAKEYTPGTRAADIALFGRMLAEKPEQNVDAAAQVAHAISTHAVNMEVDFYTAVDDLQPSSEPGAGMMGTIEFASACYYRYSLVDFDQLLVNLNGDRDLARRAALGFMRASIEAIPTGRQTSMAAHNPPSVILAVAREKGAPWSLANAFEEPVRAGNRENEGMVARSAERLGKYWTSLVSVYGEEGVLARPLCTLEGLRVPELEDQKTPTIASLLDRIEEVLL